MLAKMRHFLTTEILRNLYFGIFYSLMTYGAQVWGQHNNIHIRRISKLNDKAIRIMNFAKYNEDPSKHYKNLNILKFQDIIKLNNYLYVHDHFNSNLPISLLNNFKYIHSAHNHNTKISSANCVELPKSNTLQYGIHSVFGQSIRHWNRFQVILKDSTLHAQSKYSCKVLITKHLISLY